MSQHASKFLERTLLYIKSDSTFFPFYAVPGFLKFKALVYPFNVP